MELVLNWDSGESITVGIQPGDEVSLLYPDMTIQLIPDCEEDCYDSRGDCDGRTRAYLVIKNGSYRHLKDETAWLCLNHMRQAVLRNEVRKLA